MFKATAYYPGSAKIVEAFDTWQEARDRVNFHIARGATVAEWGR